MEKKNFIVIRVYETIVYLYNFKRTSFQIQKIILFKFKLLRYFKQSNRFYLCGLVPAFHLKIEYLIVLKIWFHLCVPHFYIKFSFFIQSIEKSVHNPFLHCFLAVPMLYPQIFLLNIECLKWPIWIQTRIIHFFKSNFLSYQLSQ